MQDDEFIDVLGDSDRLTPREMDEDDMIDAAGDLEAEFGVEAAANTDMTTNPSASASRLASPNANEGSIEPETSAPPSSGPISSLPINPSKAKAKTARKPNQPKAKPKLKAKPAVKTNPKSGPKARVAQLKASASSSSRGRSVSEVPSPSIDRDPHTPAPENNVEDDVEEEAVDNKLYCVCQTVYDDDSIMIACDKCDEWYHPRCVGLGEASLELVDTFYCPNCVAAAPDPSLLVTSYKPVCARPSCSKPARTPLSKYCSDDCGIRVVMARVDAWGGDIRHLMEHPLVSSASPIESRLAGASGSSTLSTLGQLGLSDDSDVRRQMDQIQKELNTISLQIEKRKRIRQSLDARLLLLDRAIARTHSVEDVCGFDDRMILDEKPWDEWLNDGGWDMLQTPPVEGEQGPWCCGRKRKCEWHYGWEDLKRADFTLEYKVTERRIADFTFRESELKGQLENLDASLRKRQTIAALAAKQWPNVFGDGALQPPLV